MAMSGKGYIVHRSANQIVPKEYLETVLRQEPSYMAVIGCLPGEDNLTVSTYEGEEMPGIDQLMAMQDAVKEIPLTLYFGDAPPLAAEGDKQPHVLACRGEEEQEPVLVALLEGDFNGFAKPDVAFSEEYQVVAELLQPMVAEQITNVEGDPIKLLELFSQSNLIKTQISSAITGRGNIVLYAPGVEPLTFSKGKETRKTVWGWTSDILGWGEEAPVTTAKKIDPFKAAMVTLPSKPKAEGASVPPPPPAPKATVTPPPPSPTETKKEETDAPSDTCPPIACPAEIKEKDQVKKWYRDRGVNNVDKIKATDGKFWSWNKHPEIIPTKGKEYDEWVARKKGVAKGIENVTLATSVKPVASTTPILQTGTEKPKDVSPHHIPPVNTQLRQKFADFMAGKWHEYDHKGISIFTTDTGGRKIIDPRVQKQLDAKHPSFYDIMGYKTQETFGWPRELFMDMVQEYPGAVVTLLLNFRSAMIGFMLAKKDEEVKTTSAPVQTAPQPTESAPVPTSTKKPAMVVVPPRPRAVA
jgi:hypothetical protein